MSSVSCSCSHAAGRFVSELSLLSNRWGVHTDIMSRDLVHPGDTWPADVAVTCGVTSQLTPSGGKSSVVACTTRQVVTSKASDCRLLFAADIVSCWGFARYLPELSPLVREALPAAVGTIQAELPVTTQLNRNCLLTIPDNFHFYVSVSGVSETLFRHWHHSS